MKALPRELKYIQTIALVLAALIFMGIKSVGFINSAPDKESGELYLVSKVVDGDTLKLSGGQKVRLIGVDTPELHYSDKLLRDAKRSGKDVKAIQALGAKASDFTKNLCLKKRVRLEYDVVKHDKYGRLLSYVYLEDGTFVNAKILEEGFGQVMTIPPNVKHADHFKRLEQGARSARKGLWKFD